MPVSGKKKGITAALDAASLETAPPELPKQQEFHQHLRALAQSAVRIVIETVMREELDAFIGAAWGESSPSRTLYGESWTHGERDPGQGINRSL